ncbi:MAG: Dabb family protein [Actinobacteria bacterium]|nr:Dabb family protein [Actinomycetota bacterium]
MSLRHVVLLRFHEGTEASQGDALVAGLRELPALIEGLRSFQTGADLGLAAGNWDLGIAVEFDDEATWAAYQAHPEHQRVIAELVRPITAERAAAQFAT